MKTFITAAATATLLSATAAYADGLTIVGGAEYALEAETLEATTGFEYNIGGLMVSPVATIGDITGDVGFAGLELTAEYEVISNITAGVVVDLDQDFEYTETTFGIAFRF